MAKKNKIVTSAVAIATAAALMLGGTFAWQSINQTALNEASDVINPGGRLHDDFDGSNKDVYVENFADEDIFARIQLSEYFAVIANYGKEGAEKRNEIIGTLNDDGTYTYVTYKFDGNAITNDDGTVNTFKAALDADGNPYWNWATGGSTVFMPTFNLNKDSLVADINGTYVDAIGGISNRNDPDHDQYENYTDWSKFLGENGTTGVGATMSGTEIYDGDANSADEVGTNFDELANYGDNVVTVDSVEHTAKNTLTTTGLISMADWLAMVDAAGGYDAAAHGNYWVYDTDGWVYWSAPIAGRNDDGTTNATGLLLDGIELNGVMDDTWYYAINVVAQFVTADDVGKTDGTGFYDTENGTVPSADAESLLDLIGVEIPEVVEDFSWIDAINAITPGSADTVTIDGVEWYVLANDGSTATLWAAESVATMAWSDTSANYTGNAVSAYLNGEYLNSLPTVNKYLKVGSFVAYDKDTSEGALDMSTVEVQVMDKVTVLPFTAYQPIQDGEVALVTEVITNDIYTKRGTEAGYVFWSSTYNGDGKIMVFKAYADEFSYAMLNYAETSNVHPVMCVDLTVGGDNSGSGSTEGGETEPETTTTVLLDGYESDSVLAGWSYTLSTASRSAYTYAITAGSEYATLSDTTLKVNEDASGDATITVAVTDGDSNQVATKTFSVNPIVGTDTVSVTDENDEALTVYNIGGNPTILATDLLGKKITVTLPNEEEAYMAAVDASKYEKLYITGAEVETQYYYSDRVKTNSVYLTIDSAEKGTKQKTVNGVNYSCFAIQVFDTYVSTDPDGVYKHDTQFYLDIIVAPVTTAE